MDVAELSKRAKRIAAIGQIVETFDTQLERISLVQALVDAHIISEFAADILLDEYAPGAAL